MKTSSQKRKVAGVVPAGKPQDSPVLGGIQLQNEIHVERSPQVCYRFWRDLRNLPLFFGQLESITVQDATHSHWSMLGPGDTYLDWDAEIITDEPDRLIAWRSVGDAQLENAGSVHFIPDADLQATLVKVVMTYNPPAGPLGEAIADLFGETPADQLEEDLEKYKELVEKH